MITAYSFNGARAQLSHLNADAGTHAAAHLLPDLAYVTLISDHEMRLRYVFVDLDEEVVEATLATLTAALAWSSRAVRWQRHGGLWLGRLKYFLFRRVAFSSTIIHGSLSSGTAHDVCKLLVVDSIRFHPHLKLKLL